MSKYPEIYVIRHGQTEWNLLGRHQGRLDSPLTKKGRAQARAIGEKLAIKIQDPTKFTAYASPQGRTQASAELMLAKLGMPPLNDRRLQEIAFGSWEGLTLDEIATEWPERALMVETEPFLWHFESPGGESLADITDRCQAFLDDLTGPAILITHGITSRVLRGLWLGLNQYEMGEILGGQGVIYHLSNAKMHSIHAGG